MEGQVERLLEVPVKELVKRQTERHAYELAWDEQLDQGRAWRADRWSNWPMDGWRDRQRGRHRDVLRERQMEMSRRSFGRAVGETEISPNCLFEESNIQLSTICPLCIFLKEAESGPNLVTEFPYFLR